MLEKSIKLYGVKGVKKIREIADNVNTFLQNRMMHQLSEDGFSKDVIAAVAGVSKRTLHLACQVNLGLGVMTFVFQHRLNQANQQLLDAEGDAASVTEVAMNSGFRHLSRFSSAYRKRFGEYPSETLQRRQSGGGTSISGHQTTPGTV